MSEAVVVETQEQLRAVLDQISDGDHRADRSATHFAACRHIGVMPATARTGGPQ
jgi:hypothetical protein